MPRVSVAGEPGLTAPPPPGGPTPPVPVKHADLVVQMVRGLKWGQVWSGGPQWLVVRVKNIGDASAPGGCSLVAEYTSNMLDPEFPSSKIKRAHLPTLAPNDTVDIAFSFDNYANSWRGMLIAVVDPALAGKPYGQVREQEGELNNVFGFTFDAGKSPSTPEGNIEWWNPAAK